MAVHDRPSGGEGYAVLDVLTTGASPVRDRVVELALVQLDPGGVPVREWTTLVASVPGRHAAPACGLAVEELTGAPTFPRVAGQLVALLAGRVVVAHHGPLTWAFLRAELAACGVAVPVVPVVSTVDASWAHLPGLRRRGLPDCARAAGVPVQGERTALRDARAIAGLLRAFGADRSLPAGAGAARLADLVHRARTATWPAVPGAAAALRPRQVEPARALAAPRSPVAALAARLPLDGPALPLPAACGYVQVVADTIAALAPTDPRVPALADVARAFALPAAQVQVVHREVIAALAAAAGGPGRLAERDRRELSAWAGALGVDVPALSVIDLREPVPTPVPALVRAGAQPPG